MQTPPLQPHPYYRKPARKMSTKVLILIIVGVLVVVFAIVASIMTSISEFSAELSGSKGKIKLHEQVLVAGDVKDAGKIAVITINEPILGEGSYLSGSGLVYKVSRQLRRVAKSDAVKAVLLQINSPGGGLAASDIINDEVKLVQKAGKPVVVCIGNLCASGGYYIAAPTDYIIAGPTSLVGSIGVIMQRFEVKELMRMIGIKWTPIKSSEMKDLGSPFRSLTEEEMKYLKELIDIFYNKFISIIASGRSMSEADVRKLANGKIYTSAQALEFGLIDEIGYFNDALDKAKELGNAEGASVIRYEEPFDFKSLLTKFPGTSSVNNLNEARLLLQGAIDIAATPQIRAVWNGSVAQE